MSIFARLPRSPAAPLAAGFILVTSAACDLTEPPPATILAIPIAGEPQQDWFYGPLPNHDVERGGAEDYLCGTKTIEFRQTTDFLVPSFREMDQGVDVLAAASGVVTFVQDGFPDRNLTYEHGRQGNQIRVHHPDGMETRYRFLKSGSIQVREGDQVTAGQVIAQVGSSGNSNWPRLGFEVRTRFGDAFDPWAGACSGDVTKWRSQPDYPNEFIVVDFGTTNLPLTLPVLANRPPDVTTFQQGEDLTFWVHIVNRPVGRMSFRLESPDGAVDSTAFGFDVPNPANTIFGGLLLFGDSAQVGPWAIEYAMNDEPFARLEFNVVEGPAAASRASSSSAGRRHAIAELRVGQRLRLEELDAGA